MPEGEAFHMLSVRTSICCLLGWEGKPWKSAFQLCCPPSLRCTKAAVPSLREGSQMAGLNPCSHGREAGLCCSPCPPRFPPPLSLAATRSSAATQSSETVGSAPHPRRGTPSSLHLGKFCRVSGASAYQKGLEEGMGSSTGNNYISEYVSEVKKVKSYLVKNMKHIFGSC